MNIFDITWAQTQGVAKTLGVIYGLIAVVLALAFVATRPMAFSSTKRRWPWFISAGLMLGGIFAIALAFHLTNGHPQPSNALLWIGLGSFITAIWRLITRPSV